MRPKLLVRISIVREGGTFIPKCANCLNFGHPRIEERPQLLEWSEYTGFGMLNQENQKTTVRETT